MGFLDALKRLFGAGTMDPETMRKKYEAHRRAAEADLPASPPEAPARLRRVGVFTLRDEFRDWANRNIRPLTRPRDCEYMENPPLDGALKCQVVVFDVHPQVDIKLHHRYDQVVRVKKSLNKMGDLLCAVGPREKYVEYPRGTYPGIHYFPVEDYDFATEPEDIPPGGMDTFEGPKLHRVSDLKSMVAEKLESLDHEG